MNTTGTSTLEYCVIENGQSIAADPNDRGGAVYILNSNPVIKNCTLRNNKVKKYGSAIYCDNGSPLIEGCTITNNQTGYGNTPTAGTIYCTNSSQPKIIGNSISHNTVGAYGGYSAANAYAGGIYLSHSDAEIRGNVISYNSVHAEGNIPSHARGGAIYLSYSNPVLTGNTIYSNETSVYSSPGEGGALYIAGSNPVLVNNILWNDTPEEVFFSETGISSVMIAYSDVKGGKQSVVSSDYSTTYWQEGNINKDPKFTDAGQDDFTLLSNSPAIDAGTAQYTWQGSVIAEIDASQYSGTAPDMGALEYGSSGGINQSPVALATATPDHGSSPLYVQFSSDGSSDPDGTITSYSWEFGDGSHFHRTKPFAYFNGSINTV